MSSLFLPSEPHSRGALTWREARFKCVRSDTAEAVQESTGTNRSSFITYRSQGEKGSVPQGQGEGGGHLGHECSASRGGGRPMALLGSRTLPKQFVLGDFLLVGLEQARMSSMESCCD